MTARSPLVLGDDGLIQQLQPGDTFAVPTTAPSLRAVTNGEGANAIPIGTPVYASAADTVKRGQANAKATSALVGVGYDASIAAGANGNICEGGVVVATTAQWDAVVTGETGGLTFQQLYYLDAANAGKLTATRPTTAGSGQCVTVVGRALSATELELLLRDPILL